MEKEAEKDMLADSRAHLRRSSKGYKGLQTYPLMDQFIDNLEKMILIFLSKTHRNRKTFFPFLFCLLIVKGVAYFKETAGTETVASFRLQSFYLLRF